MKLRNKETGEIRPAEAMEDGIYLYDETTKRWYKYTLYLLAKYWQYYEEPKEPLIKDEKIRKAVRAWAEANGDTKAYYNRPTNEICIEDNKGYVIRSIKFKFEFKETIGLESGEYTIAELCGKEDK